MTPLVAALFACACQSLGAVGAIRATDEVDDLIAEGRRMLALYDPERAEGLFLQAAELEGGSLKTRMWVLRAWMDQGGRSNDTLDAIDELSGLGHEGPELDYLYGMAFARRGEEQLAQGLHNTVRMNFLSTMELLQKATAADPDRFHDAFLPLANAAWSERDLDLARSSANEAVARHPREPDSHFMLGHVALSQYRAAQQDGAEVPSPGKLWDTARDSFARTVELIGRPRRDREIALIAKASLQLGHTLMWKKLSDEAVVAYATAIEWDPTVVDYGSLLGVLGNENLNRALERGVTAFRQRRGKKDERDGTLLWWLGYTRFQLRKMPAAEEAFLASLDQVPDSANAWHYVALARSETKDYPGAIEAFRSGWGLDPAAMVAEMQENQEANLARVEYLVRWATDEDRLADAVLLSELCAETAQWEPRYWNNLGLFLRDHGEELEELGEDEEELTRIYEDSYRAYTRALSLLPEDPALINDTAVVLHYYLDRDLDRALSMYAAARAKAEELLQREDLTKGQRELYEAAKRDATENHAELKQLLEERKRKAKQRESAGG